jgi:putative transposase
MVSRSTTAPTTGPNWTRCAGNAPGVTARKNLGEVHRDPYDISPIWLRNHWDGGWIILFWKHLRSSPASFGELAWNHALAGLREHGENPTEPEIAAAVTALLDRAAQGPDNPRQDKPSKRDSRVAARTVATGPSLPPTHQAATDPRPHRDSDDDLHDDIHQDEELAEVIPLGVFDVRMEAQQSW